MIKGLFVMNLDNNLEMFTPAWIMDSASQVGGSSKSEWLNSDLIITALFYHSKEN